MTASIFQKISSQIKKIFVFQKSIFNLNFINYLFFLYENRFLKKTNNIFIFDNFESFQNTFMRSLYLNFFSRILKADLFYINYKFNPIYKLIYFCLGSKNLKINLSLNQKRELEILHASFFNKVNSKKEILDYEIDKINLGMDIYESYLIKFNEPTIRNIRISNKNLNDLVRKSLKIFIFWRDYFIKNKHLIKGVLLSHRNYIETNILNRISIKNKINVYTLSGEGHSLQRWKNLDLNFFNYYSKIFQNLSDKEKKEGILLGKKQLDKRFSGEVGVDMNYSTKSAFSKSDNKTDLLIKDNNKLKILICSACFYDNPHCYGKMMFEDFYECLKFLGKLSKQTNYDWYIKPHPDYLPGTIENINECANFFDNLTLLDPNTSFHTLKNKINFAITPYGSVGHELPLLGIPVINCSNVNPHQDFKFNFTPKNKDDLKEIILNIKDMKNEKIDDIFKFYYIHYIFFNKSNLFSTEEISKLHINLNVNIEMVNFFKSNFNNKKKFELIESFIKKDEFKTSDRIFLKNINKLDNTNFK